jgi:hypothetical protein
MLAASSSIAATVLRPICCDRRSKRIKSGEIPSVRLGHNIKVKREDLEGYLEAQRYHPTEDEHRAGEQ